MRFYTISVKKGEKTVYSLDNLDQIYGLLTGVTSAFSETFVSMKHFKAWWRKRKGKQQKLLPLLEDEKQVEILIETRY